MAAHARDVVVCASQLAKLDTKRRLHAQVVAQGLTYISGCLATFEGQNLVQHDALMG